MKSIATIALAMLEGAGLQEDKMQSKHGTGGQKMGLDIDIIRRKKEMCPHCGKHIADKNMGSVDSGGRVWYPFLERVGYYVPYEQRTEENDWYGKDMVLTHEETDYLFEFVKSEKLSEARAIKSLIALARYEGDDIVINADW